MLLLIFLLILLMAGSFTFSGSETVFFSLSEIELKNLIREKHPLSGIIFNLSRNRNSFLLSILFYNTVINIAFVSLSELLFEKIGYGYSEYTLMKILTITFVLLMFCEVMPKILSLAKKRIFIFLLVPAFIFFYMFYPFDYLYGKVFKNKKKKKQSKFKGQMKELLIYLKENETHVKDEVEFLEQYNQLKNKEVYSICVKREGIIFLKNNATVLQAGLLFKKYRFSRIPVVSEDLDRILGIFHIKDMINLSWESHVENSLRRAHKIDYRAPVFKVMNYFLKNKTHIAVLVDSVGKTLGIVTMQDIIDDIIKPIEERG
ncbi:MAG: hypothetical protein COX48_01495 [bacterium (Candidatus Stahlbacteria) CG23_combo_of_CG06-09_8_20_14_all_34_7]|nr:MAG: hypothetical protein COX48_01495 [bacterium (Candidatus Stahlbacteria) CG23_combo_of_CG06-09_8_20_14_all_34_7]